LNGTTGYHCEATDGKCPCKENFAGDFCKECAEGYFSYPECIRKFFFCPMKRKKTEFITKLTFPQLVNAIESVQLAILVMMLQDNVNVRRILQANSVTSVKIIIMIIQNVPVSFLVHYN
jgi:hypothetical protein